MRLTDAKLLFLDLETTGLSPALGDRIVEIGMIVRRGGTDQPVSQLVNPGRVIPVDAQAIHGISDRDVASCPSFGEIAPTVCDALHQAWVVGHNIRFDVGFLAMEIALAGGRAEPAGCLDTCQLARVVFDLPNYQLETVAGQLGMDLSGLHRAADDAAVSKAIFDHVVAEVGGASSVNMQQLESLHSTVPSWPMLPHRSLPRPLYDALTSGQALAIRYVNGDGEKTNRRISPQACFPAGRYVYVRAFCEKSSQMRTFRLDRIIEINAD